MADEPSVEPKTEDNENVNPNSEPEKNSDPKPETPSTSQTVKVDLGELRDLLEGLPEKTAQFIKEAVTTPKKPATSKSESKRDENAPTEPQNDTPKQPAKSKRGWLARGLFGD